MSKNNLDKFESFIKNQAEKIEFEYSPADWAALEQKLPKTSSGGFSGKFWLGAAAFATLVTISGIVYFNNTEKETTIAQTEETSANDKTEAKVENTFNENTIDTKANNAVPLSKVTPASKINEVNHIIDPSPIAESNTSLTEHPKLTKPITETTASIQIAPKIEILPFDNQLCLGEDVIIEVKVNQNSNEIKWILNDQLIGQGKKIKLPTNRAGKYGIIAKINETYQSATYEVIEKPEARLQNELEYVDGWPIHTFATNIPANWSVKWKVEGKTITGESIEHSFLKAGYYDVEAEVTNHFGCVSKEKINLRIDNEAILLSPLAFTCNDDNLNERYIPESLKHLKEEFIYEIYNKVNGRLIYRSINDASGWDGKDHFSGQDCQAGEYTWKVIIKTKEGKQHPFAGNVNLLK
ncbi:MAG: gliding motility-associated C-terminal domain-containing protein [Flavobacteriales bacterium]